MTLGAARLSRLVGAEASAQLTRCAAASALSRTTSEQRAETGGRQGRGRTVGQCRAPYMFVFSQRLVTQKSEHSSCTFPNRVRKQTRSLFLHFSQPCRETGVLLGRRRRYESPPPLGPTPPGPNARSPPQNADAARSIGQITPLSSQPAAQWPSPRRWQGCHLDRGSRAPAARRSRAQRRGWRSRRR